MGEGGVIKGGVSENDESTGEDNWGKGDKANKLYLLANPFMTHLNMKRFFEINTMFTPAYWLMTADKQIGVIMQDNIESSSSDAISTISPLQGFFVQLADGQSSNLTVLYTADMMADVSKETTIHRSHQDNLMLLSANRKHFYENPTI